MSVTAERKAADEAIVEAVRSMSLASWRGLADEGCADWGVPVCIDTIVDILEAEQEQEKAQ